MSAAKELPKVISKTQEEIERISALIESSQLPKDIIEFIIGQGDKSQNRSKKQKNKSNKQSNNRSSDVQPSDETLK